MSREIHKKVLAPYFDFILENKKTFDLRLADWECAEGDVLVLDEINATTKVYTGRSIRKKVGFVLKTKNLNLFPKDEVELHGYQIISLLGEGVL
jgi:hypothetical protein